jgi:hypothetical protein
MERVIRIVVLASVALAACGGSGAGNGGPCTTTHDCPEGLQCIDDRCIAVDGGTDPGDGAGGDADSSADADADGDGAPPDEVGAGDADGDGEGGAGDGDADGGDGATCVDVDGDGRGAGCALGSDCNDADPLHWEDCTDCATTHAAGCLCAPGEVWPCYEGPPGTEGEGACAAGTRSCEGGRLSAECAGDVLPEPFESCGDGVDNDCNGVGDEEVYGPCGDCDATCRTDGETEPDPSDPGSTGLMDNPDGPGVVLGTEEVRAGYLWAANDPDGSVSKLDLTSGAEVARYRVGLWGDRCDSPSRTAVDSLGNAYVADRAHVGCGGRSQGSVTKMAGDRRFCVDRNGNTVIDTSTGPAALALGEDECVIWRVPVAGGGGIPRALAIDFGDDEHLEGHPWVGAFNEMRAYQLDPDDGAVLAMVDLSVNTYGFAIDSNGWIWVAGRGPAPYIQRFHTVTLAVDPRIDYGCTEYPYGITIDIRNRVWIGSWSSIVCRYDPSTGGWLSVNVGCSPARGVAADADGTIWASCFGGNALYSFSMEDGSGFTTRASTGGGPIGVGVDELGHVWTVNQGGSNATRLTKATGTVEHFSVGPSPYTYSDFTGYQRRLMIPRGTWTRDYERCDTDSFDRWGTLEWDADVPAGARLTITGASATTVDGLDAATDVTLATVPSDVPPVDITAAFAAAGVPLYAHLRITVTLEASPDRDSPVFRSIDVHWHCYRMP